MMCVCGLRGLCCAFGVSCAVCVDVVAVLLAVFVLSVLSVSWCFASAVGLVVIVCGVGVRFVGAVCVVCVVCCQFFCVSSSCVICFSCVSFSILCISSLSCASYPGQYFSIICPDKGENRLLELSCLSVQCSCW